MKLLTRVKICGMLSISDIEIAIGCGADAVGFITEVPVETPRNLKAGTAAELIKKVPLFVDSVLVIMPHDAVDALDLIDRTKPDIVQIHKDISVHEMEIIRNSTDKKLIRTFSISVNKNSKTSDLIHEVEVLAESDLIDGILLDTGKAGSSGGTGMVHDWSVSRQIVESVDIPAILAGGLDHENVRSAVKKVSPFAVDTASGVESNGKKDPVKIRRFIEEARCLNGCF